MISFEASLSWVFSSVKNKNRDNSEYQKSPNNYIQDIIQFLNTKPFRKPILNNEVL